MIDNAAILSLGCVGGIALMLGVGVVLMFYSFGELRTMLRAWLDRK